MPPRPTTPPVTGGPVEPESTPPPENPARSSFVGNIPSLRSLSTSPATIATNLTLSLAAFLLILLACGIFNETLKENATELTALLRRLPGPLGGMFAPSRAAAVIAPARDGLSFGFLKPVLMLTLLGGIYSALDPAFGFNTTTLALLISLAIALGFLTTVFEGGKVLVTSRFFRGSGGIRLNPLGIGVAIASVALSRLVDMHPGIVLGVVAGAAVSVDDPRRTGPITFVPMVALFIFSLVAFGLAEPLHTFSNNSGEWYAVIPETVAVTIFVAGIEGLLFQLLPLTFMEGRTVWDWSKLAWMLIAVPVGFVFFHVVVNRSHAYDAAIQDSSVQTLFAACGLFLVFSGLFWLMCRIWLPKHSAIGSHA